MPRKAANASDLEVLHLVPRLSGEVRAWRDQGWPGITQTTADLFSHWFRRDEDTPERFHECQQGAIEVAVYCHEVLQPQTLHDLYERISPEALLEHALLKEEVESIPFPKYGLKMATGSGKTWVLCALMLWQYFNALHNERPGRFSSRFLVVAPGHEVLNRLRDALLGKRDPKVNNRDPKTADFRRPLFVPDSVQWQHEFNLLLSNILQPEDVRSNTPSPDGPFVFLTNWQQFRLNEMKTNLWEQWTGEDVQEQPRGEIIAEFLSEFPDLLVLNDEAHHVHGKKTTKNEELVWRRFMNILYERLKERHVEDRGLFLQFDFSATPFYGSGLKREYFPHIIYDYDLLQAMREMLVKQLFLEQRQSLAGERLEELDFRAERTEGKGRQRGEVKGLSAGQKMLLDIGRRKLEHLTKEFRQRGIEKKPVLMVLAEETDVAGFVADWFSNQTDERGWSYDDKQVMVIHSELKDKEWEEARKRLDKINDDKDPLRIVVSVLMLREGFDKANICVVVVLRATEADFLLEQIVGRGLRMMFPGYAYPELQDAKREAFEQLRMGRTPSNSLDCLFVVEHPRFRAFYEQLRQKGYIIGEGDTQQVISTGDLIPVDAMPVRFAEYDIAWPVQIFEQGRLPNLDGIEIASLGRFGSDFQQLKTMLGKLSITDVHAETGTKAKTWKLDNRYFDYNQFLRQAANAVALSGRGKTDAILSARKAEIAALMDDYVSHYLFGQAIDFNLSENDNVLNYSPVFDHVVKEIRQAILKMIEGAQFEVRQGVCKRLSELKRLLVRESKSVETSKSIYPRLRYQDHGGRFERDFMLEVLNPSPEVLAYCKLDRKHGLVIPYRDTGGIQRSYEVDFLIKAQDAVYLLETKADRDMDSPGVGLKAAAAQAWCETASTVPPPSDLPQPQHWEYLILSEDLFKSNRGLGFDGLLPLCRALREQVIHRYRQTQAQQEGKLFS